MFSFKFKWKNNQAKSKLFVLRHFSVDKKLPKFILGMKGSIFKKEEEDSNIFDPPILYRPPNDLAIKKMIKSYLEKKNLI